MKRSFRPLGFCAVAFALLLSSGCERAQQEQPGQPASVVVGAILPLTDAPPNELSSYGVDTRKAVELATEQQNAKGGINGVKIKAIIEDSQGSAAKAVASFNKLSDIDKAYVVVGPITSPEVLSVAPVANQRHVPIISPSATSVEISAAGDFVFRTINVDTIETAEFATLVARTLKSPRVVIIANRAAGTMSYANSFERFYRETGGTILAKEILPESASDYRSTISKALARRPEAIYIAGVSNEIGEVTRQIRSHDRDVLLLSYQSAEDRRVVELAGEAVNGLVFSSTTLPDELLGSAHAAFVRDFTAKFGKPPGIFAAEIYDAVNVAVDALRRCQGDRTRISTCLMQTEGHAGASGPIGFDSNGDVRKPIAFYRYENGAPKLLEAGATQ